MEGFKEILNRITPVSLSELDMVSLMERKDTKFLFNARLLPDILKSLEQHYKILEIKGSRITGYENLYFDTPGFDLYHCHYRKEQNRFKVRYRKYVNSGASYFEIKHKHNKKRTAKFRLPQSAINFRIQGETRDFIKKKTTLNPDNLLPVIWIKYSRMTFASVEHGIRLTLDFNLQYHNKNGEVKLNDLVIAELKQNKEEDFGKQAPVAFEEIMNKNGIKPRSVSKYCLGIVQLYSNVEGKRFKSKLKKIKKVMKNKAVIKQINESKNYGNKCASK